MEVQAGVEVILNADSGGSEAESLRLLVAREFSSHGVEAEIILAGGGARLAAAARRARESPSQTVVAAGGDGTINAVASALLGTGKRLGVLPVGTFNYFARNLGIPLDVAEAVRTVVGGHAAEVDVCEVNGRIFINNSSIGLYPSIIRQREQEYRRWGRRQLVAYAAVLRALLGRNAFLNVRITTEGGELVERTPLIFVGGNKYQIEEFDLPGRRCVNRGELAIYVARADGKLGLLRLALQALLRRLRGERRLEVLCAGEALVETRRKRLPVALDGEVVVLRTPLHFKTRPGALKVLVPEGV
ncbi:MAG TPA: diacylglycerol kinase family protein [Pyrinomonadaceae bacterium]